MLCHFFWPQNVRKFTLLILFLTISQTVSRTNLPRKCFSSSSDLRCDLCLIEDRGILVEVVSTLCAESALVFLKLIVPLSRSLTQLLIPGHWLSWLVPNEFASRSTFGTGLSRLLSRLRCLCQLGNDLAVDIEVLLGWWLLWRSWGLNFLNWLWRHWDLCLSWRKFHETLASCDVLARKEHLCNLDHLELAFPRIVSIQLLFLASHVSIMYYLSAVRGILH
jgi:hypothetical protein